MTEDHILHILNENCSYLLDLEEDWDDEGSPPIDPKSYYRAKQIVVDHIILGDVMGTMVPIPSLCPGPNGSVDIDWREEGRFDVLINVPTEGNDLCEFYADGGKSGLEFTKGKFNHNKTSLALIEWLIK